MAPSRDDAPLLIFSAALVVIAGVLVAVVLLLATGRGGSPTEYEPFEAGATKDIVRLLQDGGPYYVADPFGGARSIMFALEDGKIAALSTVLPGTKECRVLWKGSVNRFVDCNDERHRSTELARFSTEIDTRGGEPDLFLIDLRKRLPPPDAP